MAYNPGVNNISGQLIGQGIQSAAGSIAQGVQQYQQNKLLASQAIGRFEGAARANPDILQFLQSEKAPPEIAKAFAKMGKQGNLDVKNAALLAQFADTYTSQKQQAQMAQFREKQIQMMDAQAKSAEREAEQDAKDAQALTSAFNAGKAFDVRSYLQSGGSIPGLKKLGLDLDRMLAPQNTLTFVSDEALNKAYPKDRYDYTFTPNEDGTVTVVDGKISPRSSPAKFVLTPEEQINVEEGKTVAQEGAKQAVALVNGVADAAEAAQAVIPQVQKIREIYASGTKSGFGQDFITTAGAAAMRLGLIKPGEQVNREQLQQLLANSALNTAKELMKGTGQVSNYERELVNKASAEMGKSPEANLRIISLSEAIAKRSIDMELERQKLVDEGLKEVQIAEKIRRWRSGNPLDKYMDSIEQSEKIELPAGWSIK